MFISDKIFNQIENIEYFKSKIFLLENLLTKKDNIIIDLSKRLNKIVDSSNKSNFKRIIYVKYF